MYFVTDITHRSTAFQTSGFHGLPVAQLHRFIITLRLSVSWWKSMGKDYWRKFQPVEELTNGHKQQPNLSIILANKHDLSTFPSQVYQ